MLSELETAILPF